VHPNLAGLGELCGVFRLQPHLSEKYPHITLDARWKYSILSTDSFEPELLVSANL
jgi:hypothetical protein